jgi:hypothetical protein
MSEQTNRPATAREVFTALPHLLTAPYIPEVHGDLEERNPAGTARTSPTTSGVTTVAEYPEIASRFARDTAQHQMTVLHDDGLYRHLLFRAPGHSFYWFELITTPGQLVFSGDGESFVFRRTTDMFEFFRSGIRRDGSVGINPHYWSEKLTSDRDSVKSYQEDLFVRLVWEQADHLIEQEHVTPEQADRFRQAIKDDIVEGGLCATADEAYRTIEDFEFYNDPSKEFDYRHEPDIRFEDAWEWFGATKDFGWWFLWVCRAIVWGIARYDKVRRDGLLGRATRKAVAA